MNKEDLREKEIYNLLQEHTDLPSLGCHKLAKKIESLQTQRVTNGELQKMAFDYANAKAVPKVYVATVRQTYFEGLKAGMNLQPQSVSDEEYRNLSFVINYLACETEIGSGSYSVELLHSLRDKLTATKAEQTGGCNYCCDTGMLPTERICKNCDTYPQPQTEERELTHFLKWAKDNVIEAHVKGFTLGCIYEVHYSIEELIEEYKTNRKK